MRAELANAVDHLIERGVVGFAGLDSDLTTLWRHGGLVDWIPLHRDICRSAIPFLGMRQEFLKLQDEPDQSLSLPNIGIAMDGGNNVKLNIDVFWKSEAEKYALIAHRFFADTELEHQLVQEMRARRIAEENFKRASEQSAERQTLFDLFIDHAPAAIALLDRDMNYIAVTRRWAEELGLGHEPLRGRNHFEVRPLLATDQRSKLLHCLEGGAEYSEVEEIVHSDGKSEWFSWSYRAWRRPAGSIGGIAIFGERVTDAIEAERRLERRNAELRRVNQELESFSSIIAHDFRTPLRTIRQKIGNLENGKVDQQVIDAIKKQTDRMETMLSDLMDYSRLGVGSQIARKILFPELLHEIWDSLNPPNGMELQIESDIPEMKTAIAPLDLILRNLIDNAVRHHDRHEGKICVALKSEKENWTITVADDGPGIPLAFQNKAFDPFTRAGRAGQSSSSGIGLALVKKTLALNGGSIEIQSDPQSKRGTIFRFRLPNRAFTKIPAKLP